MTEKEQRKILLSEMSHNQAYPFLIILALVSVAGLQAWRTIFNNFAVDEVFLNGFDVGLIQSVRELPGFLTFLVVYLLLWFREHKFAAYSVMLMGVGMALTGFFPSLGGLLITTFIFSTGFHYFETLNQSLTLQHFSHDEAPFMLARVKSFSGIINIIVGIGIFFIAAWMSLKMMYLSFGFLIVILSVFVLLKYKTLSQKTIQSKKIMFKKKYWLYYVLSFLSGARRQVFVVFAVFMLVAKYDFTVQQVTILFVLNNVLTFFVFPYIARGIRRFGERRMLSVEYASLFFVFLGYAIFDNAWIASALYILDHVFYGFAIGLNTYFQKIASPDEIAPTISTAYAINHISAVTIPIIGGALWMLNWKIPFVVGAVLALCSLFFVQKIPKIRQNA
jgi:hypothetical protein